MNLITIETERLILKGITPQDMKHIFDNLPKAEIKILLGHRSEEEYLKEEHKHKNGYSSYNRSFLLFLLIDKGSNKIIGRCGLHNWNKENKRAEIGYVMEDESFKRKNLMTEAVKSIIKYGFQNLDLNRMEALVGTENIASLRILEKFGFIKEGVLRNHIYKEGDIKDSFVFSLLKEEYQE